MNYWRIMKTIHSVYAGKFSRPIGTDRYSKKEEGIKLWLPRLYNLGSFMPPLLIKINIDNVEYRRSCIEKIPSNLIQIV